MREILFRAKRKDNGGWVEGCYTYSRKEDRHLIWEQSDDPKEWWRTVPVEVKANTVGQFTGLTDKNGTKIFEGDAVCYRAFASYDYRGIVRFGEYEQDGSGGEYAQRKCIGFFIERTAWIPQEWQDLEDEAFCLPEYEKTISLLEVEELEIIGNIHDNPSLIQEATP
jgi:uncharacterized phage protein (TIGR01671 family)